jgi:3-methyl-2-oxobutanoate hydroxymethyltransferase
MVGMATELQASETKARGRITLQRLREKKARREPIAMLTAYDFPTARILAESGVDALLVGDSAATVLLGAESTTAATMEFLLPLTGAVRRGAPDVFLMADMPFASYPDIRTAVENASRFVREAGADAVKFEMDIRHVEMARALTAAGIVLCAHVGLLPQRAAQQGGYVAQGRTGADAQRIVEEAAALAGAGAQMILLEAVPDEVTAEVAARTNGIVMGCGAGPSADGHVVVVHDMLGYSEKVPRFVEKYGDVPSAMMEAAGKYVEAVRSRGYPAAGHQYRMKG